MNSKNGFISLNKELLFLHERFINEQDLDFNFDAFFKNDFEAFIFSDIEKDENKHWYFGGKLRFVYTFRTFANTVSPVAKPSDNLKMILRYVENSYSRLEIIYYLEKFKEWLLWLKETNYAFFTEKNIQVNIGARNPLTQFYHLLEVYIINLKERSIITAQPKEMIDTMGGDAKSKVDKIAIDSPSNPEKYEHVLKIINFLSGEHKIKRIKILNEKDFNLLKRYMQEFVYDGKVNVTETIGKVPLHKNDLVYTFYKVNQYLYERYRNYNIFKFLVSCFEDLKDEKTVIGNNVRDSQIYKKFNKPSKDYSLLNPEFCD